MNIISKPRGMGRTTEIANWVAQDKEKRAMVVYCKGEAERIMGAYGLGRDNVLPFGVFLKGHQFVSGRKKIMIDNLEMFFEDIFSPCEIEGFSIEWKQEK